MTNVNIAKDYVDITRKTNVVLYFESKKKKEII